MRRTLLIVMILGTCLVAGYADDPKPAAAVVDETPGLRKQLAEATATITALQRRLRAIDQERQEAQGRIVLLLDENLRLTDELAKRSETTSK